MNILHMCLSKGFGGLEMYPLRVGKQMMLEGHQVYGIAQSQSPIEEAMAQTFTDCLSLPNRGYGYRHLIKLAKWIRVKKIRYVHCHKSSDLFLAVLLKKLCGFCLIYTDHMGVKKPKKDVYHRFIYNNVDQVLSISHFTLERNKQALPVTEAKIQALWLGTPIPDEVRPGETDKQFDLKGQLHLTNDTILIGMVGRLSQGKGHLELLKAFHWLKNESAHLVIIGGTSSRQGGSEEYVGMLKHYIAENRLENRVTFYGFSSKPETLLPSIDIVVIPSHNEAFGLTVIESMALGKAIIGSDRGAIPEILEDAGILVDPFNTTELTKAIQTLCEDSQERERLSQMAKNRAKAYFDHKVHVQKLLAIYSGLG